jgi:hypothetical protein
MPNTETPASRVGSLIDGIAEMARSFQDRAEEAIRQVRRRLPPVVIEHKLDLLERHVDRGFKRLDEKLDEVLRRIGSMAA